jgi:hypothetical protein
MLRGLRVKTAIAGTIVGALVAPVSSLAGQIVYQHGGSPQTLREMNDDGTDNRVLITAQGGISSPSQPSLAPNSTNLAFQATAPPLSGFSGAESCGYNCVGIYSLIGGKIRRVSPSVISCADDLSNCATKIDNFPSVTTDGRVVYLHAGSLQGLPLCDYYGCTAWEGSSSVFLEQSDVGGDTPAQWQTPNDGVFDGNYQPQNNPGSNPLSDPGDPNLIAYSGLEDYNCTGADSCDPLTVDNSTGTSAYNVTDADCDFSSGGCYAGNDLNVLGFSPGGKYILVDIGSQSVAPGLWIFQNQPYDHSGGASSSPIYGTGWWVWEPSQGKTIGQGGAITSDSPGQGQIIFTYGGDIVSLAGSCTWNAAPTFTTGQAAPPTISPTCTSGTNLTSSGNDNYPTWTASNAAIAVSSSTGPPPSGKPTSKLVSVTHSGKSVSAKIRCSGGAGSCPDTVGLATYETLRGSNVIAVAAAKTRDETKLVAAKVVSITSGTKATVTLTLDAAGRKLLRKFHKLPMLLLVVQGGKTVGARRVTLKLPKAKHHR